MIKIKHRIKYILSYMTRIAYHKWFLSMVNAAVKSFIIPLALLDFFNRDIWYL